MHGLRLGLGIWRGRGGSATPFTVQLTGLTSGEARNGSSIGVNIVGLVGGETITYQVTENNANISGATSSTFTVNIGTNITDGNLLRYVATIDGTPYTSNAAPARYAPGTFGALSNQSFTDDTGNQTYIFAAATGTGLTWTYSLVSPPSGVTIVSATRTLTFDTNALAIQSGTVITVRALDQYGRNPGDRTFTLAITAPTTDGLLLESGDALLLETGDRLLLEAA